MTSKLTADGCELLLLKLRRSSREALDAFGDRGMGGEQAAEVHSQEWLDDEQMRRRRRGHQGSATGVAIELGEGAGQGIRVPGVVRPGSVGLVLTRSRDGHLDEDSRKGCEYQHEQRAEASPAAIVAAAAKKEREAGQKSNGPGQRGGDGADKDVAIADVADFVRQHAFQFFVVQEV